MIMRYCEHDMVDDAEKIYMELCGRSLNPDVMTYRTLIDAYFKVGRVDSALEKYVKMVDAGLRVLALYADRWFSLLIENGKVVDCVPILTKMAEREPKPDVTTYDIVIRGLSEQGNLDAVLELVGQMVRVGVGIPSALEQFLTELFGKEGRGAEIDRLVHARYPPSAARGPPAGPSQTARPTAGPPQTARPPAF